MLKKLLKRYVPQPLWKFVRGAFTYVRRLQTWRAVLREMKGVTANDQATLTRSARVGLSSSLNNLDKWQDPQLLCDARVRVHGVGEFSLRAHSDDLYHVLPAREAAVVDAIKARIEPGATFIDAGANIGFFTVLASKLVGSGGKVIAVEMMPDTADRLRAHVADNGLTNVDIIEHALADRDGSKIRATVTEGKFGQASIVVDSSRTEQLEVIVQTTTLDAILADVAGRIALMKMDLEGAEILALLGATASLPRIDAIIFEQLNDETKVADLLKTMGYRLTDLDGNNILAEH